MPDQPTGVIVALIPSPDLQDRLAIPGGEPAQQLHLTLAHLGSVGEINLREARANLQRWAAQTPVITGSVSGVGKFNDTHKESGEVAFYASFDAPSLPFMRQSLLSHLEFCWPAFEVSLNHGFEPHITLAYIDKEAPLPLESLEPTPITFEVVSLLYGGERYDFPLLGTPYHYNGSMVKAVKNDKGEWILEVLGVPFGGPYAGRDSDGEYFDAKSELWLDEIGRRAIVHYHGYNEDRTQADAPEVIGQELGYEKKSDGVWFRVLLDKASETAARIWEAAKEGMARASSGALSHLCRIDEDGHIAIWPMAELSLMDISKGNYPANPYAVALPVAKATFKAANLSISETIFNETLAGTGSAESQGAETSTGEGKQTIKSNTEIEMPNELTPEQLKGIEALLDAREAKKAEEARITKLEADAKELEALKAQIAQAEAERNQPGTQQVKRLPNPVQDPAPAQNVTVYSKWDGFTLGQLGLAYEMIRAKGFSPSAELFRALHAKAVKHVDSEQFYQSQIVRDARGNIKREFAPTVSAEAVKGVKAINPMALADTPAVKANELMYSSQSGFGDEWVPALWSPELWDLVRNGAPVLSRFRQVEVPGESLTIPAMNGRTTVYKVAQSTEQADLSLASGVNATLTKAATANVTLTPVKGMAWLAVSAEFSEDSIIPVLPALQMSLQRDLAEQIDEILISGDTDTTNANISDTGNGSIATTWHLLIANGLRDYALGNSNASDRGSLTAEDFVAVMRLLGSNGTFALNPDNLFWVFDPGTYMTSLTLGEVLTAEKTGKIGTFESGRLVKVYGSDVVVSDRYGLTDSSGKIHNTTNNNTKGSFLLVRPDRWVVGFGRRIKIEVAPRDTLSMVTDTEHLVASFRLDFKNNGEGSALGYNVTVVS